MPPTTTTTTTPHLPPLSTHLAHLRYPLAPLLSITTGAPHPTFPATLLHYHLLTEQQLDDLAHFYHQRTPTAFSFLYPEPVVARWDRRASPDRKRRWIGRFVGLRGCASPVDVDRDVEMEMDMDGDTLVDGSGGDTQRVGGEWSDEDWDEWMRRRVWGMEVERAREGGGRKGAW